jgi:hypothetical protein
MIALLQDPNQWLMSKHDCPTQFLFLLLVMLCNGKAERFVPTALHRQYLAFLTAKRKPS